MYKRIIITILLLVGIYVKPAFAQNEIQQLNQKIDVLENRIQQLQTKLDNQSTSIYSPWVNSNYQRDPFMQMQNMQQQMNYLMNELPSDIVKVDMHETPTQYLISMGIPGMDKKNINVELRDRTLVISGNRTNVSSQNGNQYVSKESSYGSFMQSVVIPKDAELDKIKANYNNGILSVNVPLKKNQDNENVNFKKIVVQ